MTAVDAVELVSVAAVSENLVIGRDGEIPWPSLPEDRRQYRARIAEHPVALGRRTFESMRNCLGELDGVEITDVSWTRGSYEPLDSPLVAAGANAAERVVDDPVYRRSATGGGDAKVLRHEGVPTVEFGFGTQTAHGTDEHTTMDALIRTATAYALLPYEYARQTGATSAG